MERALARLCWAAMAHSKGSPKSAGKSRELHVFGWHLVSDHVWCCSATDGKCPGPFPTMHHGVVYSHLLLMQPSGAAMWTKSYTA
jgi:hypothetical protein